MIAQNGRLIIELARKGAEGPIANNRPRLDPDAGDEAFARNLGIYYRQVRYSNGTFGARVTRPPADGTPAAELSFEPGDIITALDGQPFRTHQDILSHREETTVDFINVRTNERQTATVFIP